MRRSASEKREIIRLVEESDLPVRTTLRQLGVSRSTFYGWYQRYEAEGFDGLEDKKPRRRSCWNTIPETVRDQVLDLALEHTDLSPRELACRYTDDKRYFVSESSVYRILKQADLITCPAYVLMSASDSFQNPTTRVHEMWQTDFERHEAFSNRAVMKGHRPVCTSSNQPGQWTAFAKRQFLVHS